MSVLITTLRLSVAGVAAQLEGLRAFCDWWAGKPALAAAASGSLRPKIASERVASRTVLVCSSWVLVVVVLLHTSTGYD
jgi:hypothetical protein